MNFKQIEYLMIFTLFPASLGFISQYFEGINPYLHGALILVVLYGINFMGYLWYVEDRNRIRCRMSVSINCTVFLLPLIGFPLYFISSRGLIFGSWLSILFFVLYLLCIFLPYGIGHSLAVGPSFYGI